VPRFAPEARKTNLALVELVGAIAARKKVTAAQIAIALSKVTVQGARYPENLQRMVGR